MESGKERRGTLEGRLSLIHISDADIQVQLSPDHHPTQNYVEHLRKVLAQQYPGVTFYVLPVDIVTQILNFGLSAPIDIELIGPNLYGDRSLAERMLNEVRYVPGVAAVSYTHLFISRGPTSPCSTVTLRGCG